MLDVGPYMKALEVPAWVRPTLFRSQGLPGCPSLPGEDGVLGIPSAFMFSKLDAVFMASSLALRLLWSLAPQLHCHPPAPSLLPCPTPGTPSPHPGPLPRWPSGMLCASPPGSWLLDPCAPASRLSLLFCSSSDSCVLPGLLPSPLLQFPGPARLGSLLRPALGHCRLGACLPAMAGALGLLSTGGPETELGEGRGEGRGSRNAEKRP